MSVNSHKRVAQNTIILYIRMLITMALSIFSTRIVLEALGVENYGIYNIVGSVVGFVTMITAALTLSVQRFLNYELGKENNDRVSLVFSSALLIHLVLAILFFAVLETIGYLYFKTSINIPHEKYEIAITVYHISSITAGLSLLSVPFTALLISLENMKIFAYISIGDAIFRLLISYLVLIIHKNQLVLYSLFILIVTVLNIFCNIIVWKLRFSNIVLKYSLNKDLLKHISSFASWSALGQIAWAFTLQGTNILLNIFFGNILNAAYGVSSQVQTAISKFVQSFQTAINPQIIKNYAKDDYTEVIYLSLQFTRISCFLVIVLIIPVIFQTEIILNIWLTTIPEYTPIFCRIMLINILFDTLSNIFATVIQATGKIRNYQILVSFILFLNFPLSYIGLRLFNIPYLIYIIYGFISLCLLYVRLQFVSKSLHMSFRYSFINNIIYPIIKVIFATIPILWIINSIIRSVSPITKVIIFTTISICFTSFVIFYLGLNKYERNRLINLIKSRIIHEK